MFYKHFDHYETFVRTYAGHFEETRTSHAAEKKESSMQLENSGGICDACVW